MDLPTIVFPSSSTLHALPVARDGRVRPPYFDSLDVQWPRADCDQPERYGVDNRRLALPVLHFERVYADNNWVLHRFR